MTRAILNSIGAGHPFVHGAQLIIGDPRMPIPFKAVDGEYPPCDAFANQESLFIREPGASVQKNCVRNLNPLVHDSNTVDAPDITRRREDGSARGPERTIRDECEAGDRSRKFNESI